ncbi:hypothetical protein QQY66_49210 [Streptomyces sp. DG2A-72]|uniref:hypothetical protein n=1 Tax=Streptomyces sp. DG2A-72 TaxID=3051386 RepID=UPI00265BBA07|nr:hypothetical protein [Streptomyces sp. DG2A-72]MDO0939294.1 hypothetical protein [Streptomyces sp. DG2A-72]
MNVISPLFELTLLAGALFVLNGLMLRKVFNLVLGNVLALMGFTGGLLLGPDGGWFTAWMDWVFMGWTIAADVTVWIVVAKSRAERAATRSPLP